MKKAIGFLLAALGLVMMGAPSVAQARPAKARASGMTAFRSDAALRAFFKARRVRAIYNDYPPPPSPSPSPPPPPPPPVPAPAIAAPKLSLPNAESAATDAAVGSPNITNRQEADVDEGGIVKVHGQHLVILRRGRLFTVSTADRSMRPFAAINAFPPGASGQGAWYDEMLIAGNRIIVIGYSYDRQGTEINRFTIGADGSLRYDDTHYLRSNDYYSSRNYASRLIGNQLIFYTPLYLDEDRLSESMPAVRHWQGNGKAGFRRIMSARNIYMAAPVRARRDAVVDTLHSVTSCDVSTPEFKCTGVAVLGSESRSFYVSGKAVYVWVSGAFTATRGASQSMLYRMPLNGARPSAIRVGGGPIDQFSFREDPADGVLNVVVRGESGGDAMWRPEVSDGDLALLRLSLARFGDGSGIAPVRSYRNLPRLGRNDWSFQNRFVGRHLLYAGGAATRTDSKVENAFAIPLDGGAAVTLGIPHSIERIEVLGSDAVMVGSGSDGALGFSSVQLDGVARVGDTYRLPAASQGESRSHAFFYRPDSADGASGLLGLPIARALAPGLPRFLGNGSAIMFLARDQRRFTPLGDLAAKGEGALDDQCQASCVDWYGNARPIFLGDRIFALMGYELVEGAVKQGRIDEVGRTNFAPRVGERKQ